ncbi:carbapenem-hydrolyzing class A beta-lactamase [Pseudomonas peli]|uniref:carbapenem-hydrolyzing class A beta-lactamase n=1 Tax=Pseudomonas peli TaxID=592361 RepID=UPI0024ADE45B|nr:carbapenem-hydrolyzing class A beta-lactamase [Pseudomonas peli]
MTLPFSALLLFSATCVAEAGSSSQSSHSALKELEADFGGSIGVYAIDTGSTRAFSYRSEERFPLCSSFKGFLAAAILSKSQNQAGLLDDLINYKGRALEPHSPITARNISSGMTVSELSAAAVQFSDNGATNLLLEKHIGGPEGLTSFMRSIGDKVFRLDRLEPELNTAYPGDVRDTSTPKAVATSLEKIIFGSVLDAPQRLTLVSWLKGNTTGDARIRSVLPKDWIVGDKTGTCGAFGTANDMAVIFPEGRSPIVLAVYTKKTSKHDWHSDEVIAQSARIVLESFGAYR